MSESAALLVDEVLPGQPMRQWVLSFLFQLRFLFASHMELMGKVLRIALHTGVTVQHWNNFAIISRDRWYPRNPCNEILGGYLLQA
jgi:hypothetical protein